MQVLQPPRLKWEEREEKVDRWNNLGIAWFAGILTALAFYHVPTLWDKQHKLEHQVVLTKKEEIADRRQCHDYVTWLQQQMGTDN